jgi:hypothetical protein
VWTSLRGLVSERPRLAVMVTVMCWALGLALWMVCMEPAWHIAFRCGGFLFRAYAHCPVT